eukprot:gene3826-4522_t
MEFEIGSPPATVLKCCKTLFFQAYSLKTTMFNDIISELKMEAKVRCFAWMEYYFRLLGDEMPNSEEKHLKPTDYQDIYVEYSADMDREGQTPFVYSAWGKFWKNVFPYVKIREFK